MARTTAVCHPYSSPCLGPEPEPFLPLLLSLAETLSLTLILILYPSPQLLLCTPPLAPPRPWSRHAHPGPSQHPCRRALNEPRCTAYAPPSLSAPLRTPPPADPLRSPSRYESQTEGTFKSAEQVKDKKSIYTAIVGGLIVVAFVAPMVQFWFYTGGD